MKQRYQAVVFDLDGTALDSKFNITAFAQVYRDYFHKEPLQADLELGYGMTAYNAIRYVGVPEEDIDAFARAWGKAVLRLCKTESKLYDGIWSTMCALHEAGIILGINSSRRMEEVAPLRTYITEPFLDLCKVIVTCDQVKEPKPAPDSLLFFMQETGLSAEQVLFVGDSSFDSGCAQSAGCDFALAMWGAFQPELIPANYRPANPCELLALFS